jgi:hypothetical protein
MGGLVRACQQTILTINSRKANLCKAKASRISWAAKYAQHLHYLPAFSGHAKKTISLLL